MASLDWSIKGAIENGLTPEDFVGNVLPSGTVNFEVGQTSQTIQVFVQGDRLVELNETLKIELSTPSDLIVIDSQNQEAQTIVFNEDTDWSLNLVSQRSIDEEDIGESLYEFTITREGFIDQVATIDFAVTGSGLHQANANDFVGSVLPSGTVSFLAGETSQTITIAIARDHLLEETENFKVTISNIQATGGQDVVLAEQELTIVNDDNTLALTTNTPEIEENDQGITEFVFTITRTGDIRSVGTVDYAVTGQNGLDATDFEGNILPSGTIQLPANESSVTVTIPVSGDITIENNNSFLVSLSNPSSGFTIADGIENATIIADDIHFNLTGPSSDNQLEVDTGATNDFEFTVTRTGDLRFAKTVQWTVVGSGQNPISNEEFLALSGSVDFASGETSKTITIQVKGDLIGDPQESFTIAIQAPNESNVYTGTTSLEANIIDNEAIIHIASNQVSVVEGDQGAITEHVFTITRSGYLLIAPSVDYHIESFAGISADDFVGATLPSGTVSFASNETVKTITIQVQGDKLTEANENFTVKLDNGSANVDIQGPNASSIIITDDSDIRIDAISTNSFETYTGAQTTISWEISRNLSDGQTSVNWSLKSGSFDLSDVGGTLPSGTITFAHGENKKVIEIQIPGDEKIEADQAYTLELSNPGSNASLDLSAFQATNIVKNDDIGFNLNSVDSVSLEGNTNGNQLTYKVVRSVDLDKVLTIQYMVDSVGNNGVESNDFVVGSDQLNINGLPSGTVSFGIGESEKLITLNLSGDSTVGNDESLTVRLINAPEHTHVLINNIAGTIQNDDSLVTFTMSGNGVSEGNESSNSITLTFTRSGNLTQAAQLDYLVSGYGEDASLANDFLNAVFPSGTIQFLANESTKTISLNTSNDSVFEGKEFFKINFSNFVGTEVIGSGTVFSMNPDDSVISINASNAILAEGGINPKQHQFLISRTGDVSFETTLSYTVKAGLTSGADSDDFLGTFPSGIITLAAGESSKVLNITPSNDYVLEQNENYIVEITSTQAGVSILKSTAEGTIV
ncbi:hypothetical protein MJH12_17130, partial [bacterium]|nr:hypothetical protein [bacterium]